MKFIQFISGAMLGFAFCGAIEVRIKIPALENRVTQLETALKAQALINEARVQLRENP